MREAERLRHAGAERNARCVHDYLSKAFGQANKGARRMPRRQEPKKDGASTEMPRGAASRR